MLTLCKILLFRTRWVPLVFATLLAAGCSAAKSDQPVVTPAGSRENGMLILTRVDHNRTAEVRVGERIEVRLPENPTTGFTWAIDEDNRRLLALDRTDYVEPSESSIIGARGQRSFTFTARQAGEISLTFKYWRFWQGDTSVTERYTVTLRIHD